MNEHKKTQKENCFNDKLIFEQKDIFRHERLNYSLLHKNKVGH